MEALIKGVLQWFSHTERMENNRNTKKVYMRWEREVYGKLFSKLGLEKVD